MCKQLEVHPVNDMTEEVVDLNYAIAAMRRYAPIGDDLLAGLKAFEALYDAAANRWDEEDDDDPMPPFQRFKWDYCYEIAYFNLVCREFAPLFAPAEAA